MSRSRNKDSIDQVAGNGLLSIVMCRQSLHLRVIIIREPIFGFRRHLLIDGTLQVPDRLKVGIAFMKRATVLMNTFAQFKLLVAAAEEQKTSGDRRALAASARAARARSRRERRRNASRSATRMSRRPSSVLLGILPLVIRPHILVLPIPRYRAAFAGDGAPTQGFCRRPQASRGAAILAARAIGDNPPWPCQFRRAGHRSRWPLQRPPVRHSGGGWLWTCWHLSVLTSPLWSATGALCLLWLARFSGAQWSLRGRAGIALKPKGWLHHPGGADIDPPRSGRKPFLLTVLIVSVRVRPRMFMMGLSLEGKLVEWFQLNGRDEPGHVQRIDVARGRYRAATVRATSS